MKGYKKTKINSKRLINYWNSWLRKNLHRFDYKPVRTTQRYPKGLFYNFEKLRSCFELEVRYLRDEMFVGGVTIYSSRNSHYLDETLVWANCPKIVSNRYFKKKFCEPLLKSLFYDLFFSDSHYCNEYLQNPIKLHKSKEDILEDYTKSNFCKYHKNATNQWRLARISQKFKNKKISKKTKLCPFKSL